MPGQFQIDTADRSPSERVDYWRSAVCDQFVPLAVEPGAGMLRGRVAGGSIAETRLRRIRATRHSFERRSQDIRAADPGVLHLLLLDHGRTYMEQDGRGTILAPGNLLLYDSSRPFRFDTEGDFQFTICLLPKRLLPLPEKVIVTRTARSLSSSEGVGAALAPLLASLARHTEAAEPPQQIAMQHALVSLYVALMSDGELNGSPPSVHLVLAKSFITRHLGDPHVSPADVAAACNISLSYLHRLFACEGTTVAGYLREQRLQAAYGDLTAARVGEPVIRIAERWGLPDPAHFNRLFKRRFGLTPGELRRGLTP